jgi:hypothetical protein
MQAAPQNYAPAPGGGQGGADPAPQEFGLSDGRMIAGWDMNTAGFFSEAELLGASQS